MLPGPSTITLDQESFKALASEVRVDILKKLDERRQTVTDLSGLLDLSKPTLLEHLEKLQAAGLVKRVDEGRKWIYYELSQKGRKLLHPEKVAIVLALSSAAVLAAIGGVSLLFALASGGLPLLPVGSGANATMNRGPVAAYGLVDPYGTVALVGLLLAGACAAVALVLHWMGNRRRARFFSQLAQA
jgi:DNA-binding transcriptional ArsR family regulator